MPRQRPDNYDDHQAERAVVFAAIRSLAERVKAMDPDSWIGSPVVPDGTILVGCTDEAAACLPDHWENHIVLIQGYPPRLPSQMALHKEREQRNARQFLAEQLAPHKKVGRPRDIGKELRVLEMLDEGIPVGKIAKELGIHRNTVWNIKTRTISRTKLQEKSP
jgi:hypothetical protein